MSRLLFLVGWPIYKKTFALIQAPPGGNPKTIHHVHTAQEWIRQRLGEEVSVADWAGSCGLNVDYFSRLFKSHMGMSPKVPG